uniref:Uncharacterized protein n=1 Tax=Anguilla anguilla TaxID=7936 RepID=A0A0E9PLG9_ANGAN
MQLCVAQCTPRIAQHSQVGDMGITLRMQLTMSQGYY